MDNRGKVQVVLGDMQKCLDKLYSGTQGFVNTLDIWDRSHDSHYKAFRVAGKRLYKAIARLERNICKLEGANHG